MKFDAYPTPKYLWFYAQKVALSLCSLEKNIAVRNIDWGGGGGGGGVRDIVTVADMKMLQVGRWFITTLTQLSTFQSTTK